MTRLTAALAAAVLAAGVSIASAQNAPTTNVQPSPNSINKGSRPTMPSGSEAQSTANGSYAKISGSKKFCRETSANGTLDCVYGSMSACQKANKSDSLRCVTNPRTATTGSKD